MGFRKKPIEIEAMQFTNKSKDQVFNWIAGTRHHADFDEKHTPILKIETLEGVMTANIGDWIIRGIAGEYYPCKPDIFEATYEAIDKGDVGNIGPGKLILKITQEIGDDEYDYTTEVLYPKDLMGAKVVDVTTNHGCDPEGDYDIISELHIQLLDGRVIFVTFAVDEGMLIEQWVPMEGSNEI